MTMPMRESQEQVDLREYFGFILDQSLSIEDLLTRYQAYHGLLNFGHMSKLFEVVREKLQRRGDLGADALNQLDVLTTDGALNRHFLAKYVPSIPGDADYIACDGAAFQHKTILSSSDNEWCMPEMPAPFGTRSHL